MVARACWRCGAGGRWTLELVSVGGMTRHGRQGALARRAVGRIPHDNARFAREIAETATPGDLVWVHDYHLLLVSQMLARERPVLVVGLSIHTPIEAMVLAGLPIAAGLDDAPTVRL